MIRAPGLWRVQGGAVRRKPEAQRLIRDRDFRTAEARWTEARASGALAQGKAAIVKDGKAEPEFAGDFDKDVPLSQQ
jgi:hypothetical protein